MRGQHAAKDDKWICERLHLGVKHQHAEVLLPIFGTENAAEDAVAVLYLRDIKLPFVVIAPRVLAPHQLERRREFHALGLADSENLRLGVLLVVHLNLPFERREFGPDKMPRSPERGYEPMRQRKHVAAGRTRLEKDGQEIFRRERTGASSRREFFTGHLA